LRRDGMCVHLLVAETTENGSPNRQRWVSL
jgi:hypothetical protein